MTSEVLFSQEDEIVAVVSEQLSQFSAPRNVLDIGAGSGNVAARIAAMCQRYLAIEMEPIRAQRLKDAGLDTIECKYPIDLQEKFDLVLSSHSIPEADFEEYPAFLEAAWDAVAENGMFLILTLKGCAEPPIARVAHAVTGQRFSADPRYDQLLKFAGGLGRVEVKEFESVIESASFTSLMELFESWFWQTEEEKADRIDAVQSEFGRCFLKGKNYSIPLVHHAISIRKWLE